MQGRLEPCERKAHSHRCRRYHHMCTCNGLNQLVEVHRGGSRPPVMVSTSEGQAKKETSGESEETEEVSNERGETQSTQQPASIILSTLAI